MPQVSVNNGDIKTFGFSATFDLKNQKILFDIAALTEFIGSGVYNTDGICFSVVDQYGTSLLSFDWDDPHIPQPSTNANPVYYGESTYELDLSDVFTYSMFFQTFKIQGALKDLYGNIILTPVAIAEVCKPDGFTDRGYVPGTMDVKVDCGESTITIKELTNMTYKGAVPYSKTGNGTLYYPRGTVSNFTFSTTPVSNSQVWTGNYEIRNTTTAKYDLGNNISLQVEYYTYNSWDFDCDNNMANVLCCVMEVQARYKSNCNNAIGKQAQQQLMDITVPLLTGFIKEQSGQSSANEVKYIRELLRCDCGKTSIKKVEREPFNAAVYNIVIQDEGGSTVTSSTSGNTKTFIVSSNVYSVVKGNVNDNGFSIEIDTATPYNVKYKITLDYEKIAAQIYSATANNSTLLAQFNSLVASSSGMDISNINGRCVLDLSSVNYFLTQRVAAISNTVKNIVVGTTTYNAPAGLLVNNVSGIEAWLNGLGLGSYDVDFSSGVTGYYLNVLSVGNTNTPASMTFSINGDVVAAFQKTNKSVVALLQAIVDYLCEINATQLYIGASLSVCDIDYNGVKVSTAFTASNTQSQLNAAFSAAICSLVDRVLTITSLNCDKIKAVFTDNANITLSATGRVYGFDGNGNCVSWSIKQVAQAVILAINSYADVKQAFCQISCTTSATCPEVSNASISVVSGSIGLYGLTWSFNPSGAQTVTVKYKLSSSSTWIVKTTALSVLQNGTVSGSVPYIILAGAAVGATYDVQIVNNCGGVGVIKQVAIPTGTAYPGQYLLDNTTYGICGQTPVTLYSNAPFAPGVILYTNVGMTTPVTGYTYVSSASAGNIYELNSTTGLVGNSTGLTCFGSVMVSAILGNNAGTICSNARTTLYLVSGFEQGAVLYTDAGLTTPVTGYAYVVNPSTSEIMNLNTSTGVIGTPTGSYCGVYTTLVGYTVNAGDVCGTSGETVYSAMPFGPGVTVYTDVLMTIPVVGYNYIRVDATGEVFTINSLNGIVGVSYGVC